jgi:hypothetical protein
MKRVFLSDFVIFAIEFHGTPSLKLRYIRYTSAKALVNTVGCPSGQESVCKTGNGGSNRLNEVKELVSPRDNGDEQSATDEMFGR